MTGIKFLSILALLLLFIFIFPITKLYFTDVKVTKAIFSELYFIERGPNESTKDLIRDYMEGEGWKEIDRLGGLQTFEKNSEKKNVLSSQIKIIFDEGKLKL